MRVGIGYDVHRLILGRPLVLGGVTIPFEMGLVGHSDGDVLVHAVADAFLGAVGLGDIGTHFPSDDDKYSGISSLILLEKVAELVLSRGWQVVNLDATMALQRPKLAPYILEMRCAIGVAIHLEQSRINLKASTTDGLGFEGEGQGVSAYAVVLLEEQP